MADLPQLENEERLELSNILLRIQLMEERKIRLGAEISLVNNEIDKQKIELNTWNAKFNVKLIAANTSIDKVSIDADSGSVESIEVIPISQEALGKHG
jgi:hypothetical protein